MYRSITILFISITALLILSRVLSTYDGYEDYAPAAAAVTTDPRKPYALLETPTKPFPQIAKGPTAEECYNVDYQASLALQPSYSQMTNNYKHKNGESCSALNHDLILGIYA